MTITTKEGRDAAAAKLEQDLQEAKKEIAAGLQEDRIKHDAVVARYAGNRLPKVAPMEIDIGAVAKVPVKLIPATGPMIPAGDRGAKDLIDQTKLIIDRAYKYAEEEIDNMIDRLTKLKIDLAAQRDAANLHNTRVIDQITAGFKALDQMDAMIQELERQDAEPTNAA